MDMEITPAETAELMKTPSGVKFLDVRTPEEYAIARIDGCILVDQQLAQSILESWPKDTRIVTICHHGMRSLNAASFLRANGFDNTQSMSGGIEAWSLTIDASVPRY
jgi:rhodanese-related sulfurtransferase